MSPLLRKNIFASDMEGIISVEAAGGGKRKIEKDRHLIYFTSAE